MKNKRVENEEGDEDSKSSDEGSKIVKLPTNGKATKNGKKNKKKTCGGKKKTLATNGKKGQTLATEIGKTGKGKTLATQRSMEAVKKALPYSSKSTPRYHLECTVYTNGTKEWRVKPGVGRRDETKVAMSADPRVKWLDVQKAVFNYISKGSG